MFGFDDDTYDMDTVIEQASFDEDMSLLPESVSASQHAPEDAMQSWMDAVHDDLDLSARAVDQEVPSVTPVLLFGFQPTTVSGTSSSSAISTLLPIASGATCSQDSAYAFPEGGASSIFSGSRRRLRGKRGDGKPRDRH